MIVVAIHGLNLFIFSPGVMIVVAIHGLNFKAIATSSRVEKNSQFVSKKETRNQQKFHQKKHRIGMITIHNYCLYYTC